jgi:hypothetical protein
MVLLLASRTALEVKDLHRRYGRRCEVIRVTNARVWKEEEANLLKVAERAIANEQGIVLDEAFRWVFWGKNDLEDGLEVRCRGLDVSSVRSKGGKERESQLGSRIGDDRGGRNWIPRASSRGN